MGAKKIRTARFFADHPWCCFCGGATPSDTIDHLPARIVFPNKHRPEGLEFPACKRCNEQTRVEESLLAFVCRMAGSARKNAILDANRVNDLTGSLLRGYPGLLERMNRGPGIVPINGLMRRVGALDVNQPEIDMAFCRISAKFALAEYYLRNDRPTQSGTRIKTTWTHRFNPDAQKSVDLILRLFPENRSLHAGLWKTDDTFYMRTGEREGDLYVASFFHEAVVLAAQVIGPGAPPSSMEWMKVMAPTAAHGISQIVFG